MRNFNFFLLFSGSLMAAPDYFPLHVGNQWVYRSSGVACCQTFTAEITATETYDGRTYALLRGIPGGDLRLRTTSAGDLVAYDPVSRTEKLWAAFSKPEGEPYLSEIDECNGRAVIDSKQADYKGPIGEFSNALRVRYAVNNCADAGLIQETFLPYIGLLQRTLSTIAGPRPFDLVYARIAGVTVVSERELSFSVTLDKAVYNAGERITVRMTLRHSQLEPLRIVFSSGQTYEIVARNEAGDIVYRWSDGRVFTQALRSIDFPPGEKNWVEIVPSLPVGRYMVEVWLVTATPQRAYSASIPLEIK